MGKKRNKVYMYIFVGNARFKRNLQKRFLTPNEMGYIIPMDKRHFVSIPNTSSIGKRMGILMKEYIKKNNGGR